ncbi:MAG: PQQ-like beta-propeller repeat protein [Bacteroidales bacterium]|nr:PQQ-like beta-propeller repeat protein [Bacteroidales bacterium]MCF8389877.1 PQQ-like beta-propeller repeat protein [Bacteroidales bacterium]
MRDCRTRPEGYGGASIFDDEVFILDRKKGESDILRCIDLNTGEEWWNFSYEASGELPYPGSRAVPTIDKKHIWSVGPYGDLYCINKKSHQAVWNINIVKEFEGKLTNWGFSQSPIIYKNMVIVALHAEKAGVTAFNKLSGELVWKSRPLTGINFHPSPAIANFGGVDQIIVISSYDKKDSTKTNELVAFDANSGKELWKYEGLHSFANINSPVVVDENKLFLTDCSYNDKYEPVSILLEIKKEGDEFKVNELFLTEEAGCKMHPAVFFEDHFYLNSNKRPEQMACLNLEGKNVWAKDSVPGFEMGGLILVDGLIINQNGKNGDIYLIEPSPEGYKELGKASFFNSEKTQAWAPMAFGNGKLLVRNLEKMVCVALQNP